MLSTISEFKTELKMFLLLFIAYAFFITGFHSANEGSALALTKAIVDDKTLSIDNYRDLASVDVSFYNGKYYSDKAPGRAFLGIPIYLIDKLFGFTQPHQVFFSMELMTAVFSALSVVLFYIFCLFMKISKRTSFILSAVYGFATILWTFSKTFFAHPYSAFFNLLALFTLLIAMRENKKKYLIYSGISFGITFLLEYTNIFVVIFLFVYYFFKLRFKNIFLLIMPFIAVLSLLLLYNYLIFGTPFILTYSFHLSYGNIIETIYFRSDYLKEGLNGLLFSTWRGLFYYSPILLLSFVGFFYWFRKEKDKMLPLVLLLSFVTVLLFYAATPAWRGGNSYGPRYLLAIMPFIVLPMWKTIEKYGKNRTFWIIFSVLFAYSAVLVSTGSFIGPCPAESFTDPFWQQSFPLLKSGFLDSYLYGQNKYTVFVLIVVGTVLLWFILKDFNQIKNKSIKQNKSRKH